MTTRRQFMWAVTLALGGPLVGTEVASADSSAGQSEHRSAAPTELVINGSPQILGATGVPDAIAPRVEATTGQYRSVSVSDVEFISTGIQTAGSKVHNSFGTAYGSFDATAIARELAAKTEFVRLDGQSRPSREQQRIDQATSSRWSQARPRSDAETEVLLREQPAAAVVLDHRRADVTHGIPPEDAPAQIAQSRQQSASAVPDGRGAPELASLLDGDVLAHATVGERARQVVGAELPETAERVETVVRGTRAVGIGAQVAPETTTIRYALSLDSDEQIEGAVDSLLAELAEKQGVEVVGRYPRGSGLVVDVSLATAELWTVHEQLLDN